MVLLTIWTRFQNISLPNCIRSRPSPWPAPASLSAGNSRCCAFWTFSVPCRCIPCICRNVPRRTDRAPHSTEPNRRTSCERCESVFLALRFRLYLDLKMGEFNLAAQNVCSDFKINRTSKSNPISMSFSCCLQEPKDWPPEIHRFLAELPLLDCFLANDLAHFFGRETVNKNK